MILTIILSLSFNMKLTKYIQSYINETFPMLWEQNKSLNTSVDTTDILMSILSNAPILYLEKNRNKYSGCWKLAEILDIKYSQRNWQVMELSAITLYLYAAYFDRRKVCHLNYKRNSKIFLYRMALPVIRIMIMVKGEIIQEKN